VGNRERLCRFGPSQTPRRACWRDRAYPRIPAQAIAPQQLALVHLLPNAGKFKLRHYPKNALNRAIASSQVETEALETIRLTPHVEKRLADAGQRERLSRRDRLRLGPLTTRPEGAFPSVKDLVLDIESPAEPRSKNFLPPSLVSFSSAFRAPGTL